MATSLIFSAVDVGGSGSTCGSPRVVQSILHHTDVVAASSSVGVVTPCCDAIIDVFGPIHCWAGSPPPANVGQSSKNHGFWSGRQSSGCGSGCVCSGRPRVAQVNCSYARCTRRSWWTSWSRRARETITAISPTEHLPKGAGLGVVVGSSGVNCSEGVWTSVVSRSSVSAAVLTVPPHALMWECQCVSCVYC